MLKIKTFLNVFWLFFSALVWTACPFELYAANGGQAETIRSASEYDYPPFCITTENNQADGFSVELLRAALGKMGYAVSFNVGPWAEVKESLVAREVQVLPLVGRTPEREALFDFTFPYMTMHGTIVVRSNENRIISLEDLQGMQIAVMAGDNAEEFVRRQNLDASITTTATFKEALLELSQGKHDAVIIQKLLYVQLLNELDIANLKTTGPPLQEFEQSFCFAVAKGDADLLSILNEGLSIVMADGTFQNLRKKWFASLEEPARSRIVVGGDFNYPPYEYLDENGEPAGYNVELTRAIARQLNLQVNFKLGPWGEVRNKLADQEIDMVQGMFYSPERDKVFDFADHHALISHVAVVRAGTEIPRAMADLADKTIVVMNGDIMHDQALKAGLSDNLILAKSQQEALQILSAGRGDCALIARLPAMYWVQKDNLDNLTVGEKSLATAEYCYASYQGNQNLVERFSLALSNLQATGEYRKIYHKWLGIYEQPSLRSWQGLKYILIVVGPILALLLVVFAWSHSLKKQVRLRTLDLEAEIAERKQAEQALRDSEAKQRAMVENVLDVITIMDKDGAIRFTSPNIEKWLGWRPEERIGDSPWENIHPDDRDRTRKVFADLLEKPGLTATGECRYRRKDGNYEWIEFSGVNRLQDPNIAGLLLSYHIITERKRIDEELRETRNILQAAMDQSPAGIAIADAPDGRLRYVNDAGLLMRGSDRETVVNGIGIDQYVASWHLLDLDGRPLEPEEVPLARALLFGEACSREFIIRRDDMEDRIVEGRAAPIRDESDKIQAAIVVFTDITEQKRAEEDTRKLTDRLLLATSSARLGIWDWNVNKELLVWDDRMFELYGVSPAEFSGNLEAWMDRLHPEDKETTVADCQAALAGERPFDSEFRVVHPDGTVRHLNATALVRRGADGQPERMIGINQDVTEIKQAEAERRELESQLRQAQKIESVGRLAGGVAHDYNNMLGVIIGYSELAQIKLDSSDAVQEDLQEILSAAKRSRDITQQLLAFARKQIIDPEVLDLNTKVEGTLKMLRNLLGENIDLVWMPKENLWPTEVDPTQLDQILANLCINARDAIDGVGKMTIETGMTSIDQTYCNTHPGFIPGDFVVLAVSDDGCGMDKKTTEQIFEPFFTTKKMGEGTGLGLATVFGIVKQSNGFINVYSELGKGTTFKIYLPKYVGMIAEKIESPVHSLLKGKGEAIILVEDEPAILKLSATMLQDLGYKVLAANAPSEALQLAKNHPGKVDLLITDVVMPEMNGRQLAEKMQKAFPGVNCLYMSGYTENTIAHHGVLDEGIHFIHKPFSIMDFSIKIREALGG